MDPVRFDTLVKSLSTSGTRRGVVRLVAALPVAASLAAWLSPDGVQGSGSGALVGGGSRRRRRRKAKQRHQSGHNNEHRKRKRKRKGCTPKSQAKTCAGKCATVKNNCGKRVDCGPCTCATGCPACQTCNPATGLCENVANGTGCDAACFQTGSCQNGVCVGSNPVICESPLNRCEVRTCNPATGVCEIATLPNRTVCGGSGTTTLICCNGTCWDGCCGVDGAPSACTVFVTGDPRFRGGNLGGLSGADAICRTRAMAGGLPGAEIAGTYKAWLSDGTGSSPATRFRHSGQPYVLPDAGSTKVADDWTDLTTCDGSGQCLDHAINVTEGGGAASGNLSVWTHTRTDGTAEAGDRHCTNWSDDVNLFNLGDRGHFTDSTASWTAEGPATCSGADRSLYCFQQD